MQIELRNVRVNNLKNVDLDIPHGQLIAFCGLSGSGKSSLALDTLYAEGQRRYLESLSPNTRRFIEQLDKPDADRIDGIPPAIAVKAFRGKVGRNTTLGIVTEISEYLRLMFAKVSDVVCPDCDVLVKKHDPQSVAETLQGLTPGTRYQIVFSADQAEGLANGLMGAKRNGFSRAIVGSTSIDLSNPDSNALGNTINDSDPIRIVVDRLKSGASETSRIRESIEIAFQFGLGKCEILIGEDAGANSRLSIDGRVWSSQSFRAI